MYRVYNFFYDVMFRFIDFKIFFMVLVGVINGLFIF